MIIKLAATRIQINKHKKFELRWEIKKEHKGTNDNLFEFFTQLYDLLSDSGSDNSKDFTIQLGGKSYKINRKMYGYMDRNLKEEVERHVEKDWKHSKDNPIVTR